jgi:hypothetical protein
VGKAKLWYTKRRQGAVATTKDYVFSWDSIHFALYHSFFDEKCHKRNQAIQFLQEVTSFYTTWELSCTRIRLKLNYCSSCWTFTKWALSFSIWIADLLLFTMDTKNTEIKFNLWDSATSCAHLSSGDHWFYLLGYELCSVDDDIFKGKRTCCLAWITYGN